MGAVGRRFTPLKRGVNEKAHLSEMRWACLAIPKRQRTAALQDLAEVCFATELFVLVEGRNTFQFPTREIQDKSFFDYRCLLAGFVFRASCCAAEHHHYSGG